MTRTNAIESIERMLLSVPELDQAEGSEKGANADTTRVEGSMVQKYIARYFEEPRTFAVDKISTVISHTRSRFKDKPSEQKEVGPLSDSEKLIINIYRSLSKPMKKKAELIMLALKD